MKTITTLFAILIATLSFSQMTTGVITYNIEIEAEGEQAEMIKSMLVGSTFELFFTEKKSKTILSMGTMMEMTTISDKDAGELLILTSGMMGKNAVHANNDDIQSEKKDLNEDDLELTDETKTILGYVCKKAVISDEEGNEAHYWYTEDITASNYGQNVLHEKIPGTPLAFEIDNGAFKMIVIATKIEEKLPAKSKVVFNMKTPDGYTELSFEEFQASQQQQ